MILVLHQVDDGVVDEVIVDIVEDDEVEVEVVDGKFIFNSYIICKWRSFHLEHQILEKFLRNYELNFMKSGEILDCNLNENMNQELKRLQIKHGYYSIIEMQKWISQILNLKICHLIENMRI
jgi:hypothetical protein